MLSGSLTYIKPKNIEHTEFAVDGKCCSNAEWKMRYTSFQERIDQRIDGDNLPAAHRLLKYIERNNPGHTSVNEQMVMTAGLLEDWTAQQRALSSLIRTSRHDDDIEDLVFRFVKLLTEKLNRPKEAVTLIRSHFEAFVRHPGSVLWAKEHFMFGPYRATLINIAMSNIMHPLDNPKNITIYNALGCWYSASTVELRKAYKWYRIALRIHPGDTDAIDGLISLHQQ